jgi:hypothetical protein
LHVKIRILSDRLRLIDLVDGEDLL